MNLGRSLKVSCEDFVDNLVVDSCPRDEDPSGRPCDNIFCNFLKLACTDIASEGNNSKHLSLRDIIKHIFSTHRVKFGAPSRKNEVTEYNILMGKSLCRTL